MKQIFTLISVVAFIATISIQDAQAQRWNRYKKEVGLSLGATNMLSDLGGGPGDGSRFGDFQLNTSRFAVGGFFKYLLVLVVLTLIQKERIKRVIG